VRLQTLKAKYLEFIDLEAASGIPGATWEPFQVAFLNNTTRWGIDVKSRQIAWSFTAALDAVLDGILVPDTAHLFVSINLDEAREKIRYANAIIEAIDPPARPALVRSSQTEIEFSNGSRLISHPCRPPRGKPRARIYLDEMAHYPEGMDREIYRAALPATVKGDGYIRIGSSPLGARGLFWEIVTEGLRKYPGYDGHRRYIPWWQVGALCKDVRLASQIAPAMPTQERVAAFGTAPLIDIFENMFLEDFQQEYECAWVDEATAWIAWELIQQNQSAEHLWWHAKSTSEAKALIPQILAAIKARRCEEAFAGGIDVGRKHDLTEFMAVGRGTTEATPLRLSVSLDRVPYDEQQECFVTLIKALPFTQVLVDQNGIGAQLAENLKRLTGKAQGVDFTNPSKEVWAVGARLAFERQRIPIPLDRDLAYQIHSIKKRVTAAKHNQFDTESNEKHHADKFWALALALSAAGASAKRWVGGSYQG
jgi:phage FluMu gp28-like protein